MQFDNLVRETDIISGISLTIVGVEMLEKLNNNDISFDLNTIIILNKAIIYWKSLVPVRKWMSFTTCPYLISFQ